MQRSGDADDACAEDDHVCCRWHARVLLEGPLLRGAALTWQWGLDLSASLLYTGVGPISVYTGHLHDPPLLPPRDGRDLGAADAL